MPKAPKYQSVYTTRQFMSYSSETESDEDTRGTAMIKTEPVPSTVLTNFDGPIFTAIVVEDFATPTNLPSPKVHYNTRSKGIKNEYRERELYTEEDEEYREEHELSEDYFSGDDDVFVAQLKSSSKEKKTFNHTNDGYPKVKEGPKRARKSALPWTAAESKTLSLLVNLYGAKEWQFVAKILQSKHNNNRTAAQCCMSSFFLDSVRASHDLAQRWCRVINPSINKGPWESREDKLLIEKYDDLQGSWCKIVKFFPDRTDTQCKRRYEKIMQLRTRMLQ